MRSTEIYNLFAEICIAKTLNKEVMYTPLHGEDNQDYGKNIEDLFLAYYKNIEKQTAVEEYDNPINKDIDWDKLLKKANELKFDLISFRESYTEPLKTYNVKKEEQLFTEIKSFLDNNNLKMPKQKVLEKLPGGQGLIEKIPGYKETALNYQKWIFNNQDNLQLVPANSTENLAI